LDSIARQRLRISHIAIERNVTYEISAETRYHEYVKTGR
jgi:hypothetical protein